MLEALPYLAYTIGNKGIYKHGSENAETVSKEEVDYMIEREKKRTNTINNDSLIIYVKTITCFQNIIRIVVVI